jgi:hypothetical protein
MYTKNLQKAIDYFTADVARLSDEIIMEWYGTLCPRNIEYAQEGDRIIIDGIQLNSHEVYIICHWTIPQNTVRNWWHSEINCPLDNYYIETQEHPNYSHDQIIDLIIYKYNK